MMAVLIIVVYQRFVSTWHLQRSSTELNKACRREATLVVTVGEGFMPVGFMPVDRLARSRKHNEVGVRRATAEKTMAGPGVMPASRGEVDFTHHMRCLQLTATVCQEPPPDGLELPASLQELKFGGHFYKTIAGVKWPQSLETLNGGGREAHPVLHCRFRSHFDIGQVERALEKNVIAAPTNVARWCKRWQRQ
ncbi:unnamed protein product [Ectocarpus sp. CCAP 1310/34]|nr:unnamed protein product [Ectocarpus sp. CCAP 1310/34]